MARTLYTIGHSTLSSEAFFDRLNAAGIRLLVDVRRFPGSRRHPHFGRDALRAACERGAIHYEHREALGGRRVTVPDSENLGLRNPQFRGYADHMNAPAFRSAMADVLRHAARAPTALLCAEVLWWRCHRALIADYASAHGWTVRHLGPGEPVAHKPLAAVRFHDGRLTYPASPDAHAGPPPAT